MPPGDSSQRRSLGAGKRVTKACRRCRDQKIRCTGSHPCDQCSKRNSACRFDSLSERVVVTRRHINDLHERVATLQYRVNQSAASKSTPEQPAHPPYEDHSSADHAISFLSPAGGQDQGLPSRHTATASRVQDAVEIKAPLTNPLAFHITDWVPGPGGRPVFMGTSSSWAFARRVLGMTHDKLTGSSLCPNPDNLLFDDKVYDLKWDGNKANYPQDLFDVSNLPTPDFAKYLISSVKFHCGQLFRLFEESRFMEQFAVFQQNPAKEARSSPLWFCHYLLLLAFGKVFVVQSARSKGPIGVEHFTQAMHCMPDFTFFDGDPIEKIQVLCCAALYLQSVHSRCQAYRMVRV